MGQIFGKIFWSFLLLISAGLSCWFLGKSAVEGWRYARLDRRCSTAIEKWEIRELNPSKFSILASYRFSLGDKEYEGKSEFRSFYLLNKYAAATEIEKLKKENWKVWYSSKNPRTSSLEKRVPFKALTYGLLSLAIFLYFLYIFQRHVKQEAVET
jgi:hypothetical protein